MIQPMEDVQPNAEGNDENEGGNGGNESPKEDAGEEKANE